MQITDVRIRKVAKEGKMKAVVSITIDNEFSTIGSTNLDFRSFDHNFEINAFMYSKELTTQMKNIFLDDQKKCRRITLNLWKKRPLWHKICESVVRLLSPVL